MICRLFRKLGRTDLAFALLLSLLLLRPHANDANSVSDSSSTFAARKELSSQSQDNSIRFFSVESMRTATDSIGLSQTAARFLGHRRTKIESIVDPEPYLEGGDDNAELEEEEGGGANSSINDLLELSVVVDLMASTDNSTRFIRNRLGEWLLVGGSEGNSSGTDAVLSFLNENLKEELAESLGRELNELCGSTVVPSCPNATSVSLVRKSMQVHNESNKVNYEATFDGVVVFTKVKQSHGLPTNADVFFMQVQAIPNMADNLIDTITETIPGALIASVTISVVPDEGGAAGDQAEDSPSLYNIRVDAISRGLMAVFLVFGGFGVAIIIRPPLLAWGREQNCLNYFKSNRARAQAQKRNAESEEASDDHDIHIRV